MVAIEYPKEPSKDEIYAWVCGAKAEAITDAVLGVNRPKVR